MHINELLTTVVELGGSDLHLKVGNFPIARVKGRLMPLTQFKRLVQEDTIAMAYSIMSTDRQKQKFKDSLDIDLAYSVPALGRFRCNIFNQRGTVGMVLRVIPRKIFSIADLMLPKVLEKICEEQRGLVLVTGTTGSGKSTTLAAMIDLINQTYRSKIITVEDPIEYVHTNKKALISQLEVGFDTPSFEKALRQALRQDPDVILVGELRDSESLRMALHAADTGHQVFSTVHSTNAPQTIERIIAMFPPAEHDLLLSQLAGSVEAIISQRLLALAAGGRRPAVEILRGGPVTEKFIMESKLRELKEYMETGEAGMQTFDQHILKIYQEGLISGTEAMRSASSPEALAMGMRGITRTGSGKK